MVKATCHERGGSAQLRVEGSRGKPLHEMTTSLRSGFGGRIIPGCIKHTQVLMAGGRPCNILMSNNAQSHHQYQFTKAAPFLPTPCELASSTSTIDHLVQSIRKRQQQTATNNNLISPLILKDLNPLSAQIGIQRRCLWFCTQRYE